MITLLLLSELNRNVIDQGDRANEERVTQPSTSSAPPPSAPVERDVDLTDVSRALASEREVARINLAGSIG